MTIATINPANGCLLKTFEPLPAAQLEEKLQRAADAFGKHAKLPFAERAKKMARVADILEAEKEAFARTMTTEMGKTFRSALDEALKCAWACRFYAAQAEHFLGDETVETTAKRSYIRYQPLGAILAVMPWNFPFWQVIRAAAPALMAGNVVLLKHAPNVPQCALLLEELFRRAGFCEGAFQTLLVATETVDILLGDPRIAAVTLTGSEAAGVQVAVGAAKRLKKSVLELGGSDPFVIMPSANLDEAVPAAVQARIVNNGQSCIAAKRFIVHEEIADRFEHRFAQAMEALRVGDPFDESSELGPLATERAKMMIDRQVRSTVTQGARVLTGARPLEGPGFFYAPTVLADVPEDSPAAREEIFGPVAAIFRVQNLDEAIQVANRSRYGLGASAWTTVAAECERLINYLQTGMVFINRVVASDPRLPFGGVKSSGYGRELGVQGIREFTNIKTVWVQ